MAGAALALLAFAGTEPSFAHDVTPATAPTSALTLDPGLGGLRHPGSTRNRQAQAHFDQGLKLVFAFNHEAAIRSFERAFELARHPASGRALFGLRAALAGEGRAKEAAAVQRRFRHAWRAADVDLDTASL